MVARVPTSSGHGSRIRTTSLCYVFHIIFSIICLGTREEKVNEFLAQSVWWIGTQGEGSKVISSRFGTLARSKRRELSLCGYQLCNKMYVDHVDKGGSVQAFITSYFEPGHTSHPLLLCRLSLNCAQAHDRCLPPQTAGLLCCDTIQFSNLLQSCSSCTCWPWRPS